MLHSLAGLSGRARVSGACRLLSGVAAISFLATGAIAQATPAAADSSASVTKPGTANDTTQPDIVVTALKRSTNLQQTPISISAVTEKTLTHLGATSMNDYFRQVPNLQIEGGAPTARRITIRGVRSAGESTTGLYYDETPLTAPAGTTSDSGSTNPDINLFDVDRVEVLRGPQGTLYGSGSMGGTIRVIFNKADTHRYAATVEGQMAGTKGGDPSFYTKGMINAPIVDGVLGVRVVGYNQVQGGYIDDVFNGRTNINQYRSYGGRAMITFKPTDKLTIYGTATYQKSVLDGQQSWYAALGPYKTNAQAIAETNDRLKMFNVTAKWDLPFATLTVTSSHYVWDLLRNADYTPTLKGSDTNATSCKNYFGQTAACTAAQLRTYTTYADSRLPGLLYQPLHLSSWNHEARLSGSLFGKFLDYTIGVYREKRDDHIDSEVLLVNASNGAPVEPHDLTAYRYVETNETQTAEFGEITLHPTSKLSITGGVRHFDYGKLVGGQVLISNFITQSYVGPYGQVNAGAKGWVEKGNISYQITPTLMVYATAAKGFRPGGANNIPGLGNNLVAYQPDSLWNYEGGVKSQWFDKMLTLNASVYQINWSNIQVSARSANGAFSFLTNAGTARIRGVEADAVLHPMRGLTFSGGLAYVDARLTQDQVNSDVVITGSSGLDGDRFPYVPRWAGNASVEYDFPINQALHGLLRGDLTYTGGSASQFRPTYIYYDSLSSYENVNFRTGVESDKWGAYIFVNNAFNSKGVLTSLSAVNNSKEITTLTPRTIGLMMRKSF